VPVGPRAPLAQLQYNTTIEPLYRKNITEGALELGLDTGQDLNRFILKNVLSVTYSNMTELAYPEARLHHSTFVAQCIVTDFLQICHAHIAAAQLEFTPGTTNSSPHELS
jgi:hypothetical protein